MLDVVSFNICKIFLVLVLFYPVYKILNKRKLKDGSNSSHHTTTTKRVLYQLHVNGSKVAVIFGFIHGIIRSPINQTYLITGWLLGIVMVILMGLGAFLSIKTHSKLMNREDDVKWRKIRIIKWILTVLVFLALALHYLLFSWLL
jgi:hypothetical protein